MKEDPDFYKVNYLYYLALALASLLGKIASRAGDRLTNSDKLVIQKAFDDVNKIMENRGSKHVFRKCHDGGYGMFER